MGRKLQYQPDDDASDLIARYEQFLAGNGPGYFDVEELETIVDYYLRNGKDEESSMALDLGMKLHPGNSNLQTKRAKIYLALGETQKAMRIFDSINESADYELLLLKMEALVKSGRHKEADLVCKTIFSNEVDDIDNISIDIALVFMADMNIVKALEYLKLGDAYNDKNIDLLFELAFCYEQLMESEKAIQTYNRILNIDSFLAEAWFNLGQVYFVQHNFQKALDAYDFVLAINDSDSLACLQKAHALFQLEQYQAAVDAYTEYAKLTDENWQTMLFVGECFEKMERFDDAINCYQKSLAERSDNYDALTGISICLLEKELYSESLEYIQQALKIHDETADAWVYLAEALVGLDRLDDALLAYLKSITLDPDQPDTLVAIANICLDKGEWQTALEYYQTAYNLDKTVEFIELFLAIAFLKNKDINSSLVHLKRAVAQNLDSKRLFFEICPEANESVFDV